MTIPINVFGERVESEWFGETSYLVGTRTHGIPNVQCQLDGAPFILFGLKRDYGLTLFPYVDNQADPFVTTAYLVPPVGHTPDFSLERIILGEDFLQRYIHLVNPGLMEITLHNAMGHLVRKRYQLRHRMRA